MGVCTRNSPPHPLEFIELQETIKLNQHSALAELEEMLQKVIRISFLSFVAQVWVPCSQCDDTNKNLACVKQKLVRTCFAYEEDWFMWKSHKIVTRKGITSILLSSENKSCFFPDLTHFSITEEPQAHLLQVARFNACFAICLQSSYTANNLYILQFFLGAQGSRKYEHLCSFLSFLLPTMKETLRSLKLASGKQLGEDLVVEVISFDKNDKFSSFELYQPDVLPVRFEVTQFVEQEPRYNQNKRRNPSLFETSTSEKRVRCSEQHNQNALQTCGIESNQNHTKLAEDGVVLIKAKFGDDIAKLQLLLSSGIEKLRQEVAKRFDLTRGRFKLYYLDEDEWILLACEDDLQLCMKTLTASRKTPIQMLVKSVCN